MNRISIKNLSIRWKLGSLLVAMTFLAVGNFVLVNYFQSQRRTEAAVIDVAGRNRMLSQKIAFLAEKVEKGFLENKKDLQAVVTLHNTSLLALRWGGSVSGLTEGTVLPATQDNIMPTLNEVEELWGQYRKNAETVIKEPCYIDTVKLVATAGAELQRPQRINILNPKVKRAVANLENMAEDMLWKNNSLVKRYVEESEKNQAGLDKALMLLLIANLLAFGAFVYITLKYIIQPVYVIKNYSEKLSQGDLTYTESYRSEDELGQAVQNLNQLHHHLGSAATFAENIGNGVFDSDFQTDSEQDSLGKALLEMRTRLISVAEEDKRRSWVSDGLAQFVTMLQQEYDSMELLGDRIIASLIQYMEANQGALFLANLDANPPYLELTAMYAWGRKKYVKKEVEMGEDMLGQAWREQSFVYMTDIPEDYVDITSGIGKAKPRSILIIPLKLNDEVFGMIEMASFKTYEEYELEFAQKVAERIAATVSTSRTNHQTKYLLEQSQQQAEELMAQEEEMRQNMEEITATQEEMERNQLEMSGQLAAINTSSAYIEFDLNGEILKANHLFLSTMQYADQDDIVGKHHRIFVDPQEAASPAYQEFWNRLKEGITQSGEFRRIARDGSEVWLLAYYTPVVNHQGTPVKIIKLATNITKQKLFNIETEGQIQAISKSNAVVEFDLQGRILNANDIFLQLMEYTLQEVQDSHHSMLVDPAESQTEAYQAFWANLASGEHASGEFKRFTKSGKEVWVRGSYNPILNIDGKPFKVIKFVQDITKEKKLALESQEITQQLAAQEEAMRQNMEELATTQEQIVQQMQEAEQLRDELLARETALGRTLMFSESDAYGNVTYVNEGLCEVSQYTAEALVGKPHNIFRHPEMPKELFERLWQTISQGQVFKGVIKNKAKDGSHYWAELTITPVKNGEGNTVKFTGVHYHIADEAIAEQMYAKQAEALALKVSSGILSEKG